MTAEPRRPRPPLASGPIDDGGHPDESPADPDSEGGKNRERRRTGFARIEIGSRVTHLLGLARLHPTNPAFLRDLPPGRAGRGLAERAVRPLTAMPKVDQVEAALARLPGFREHLRRVEQEGRE